MYKVLRRFDFYACAAQCHKFVNTGHFRGPHKAIGLACLQSGPKLAMPAFILASNNKMHP